MTFHLKEGNRGESVIKHNLYRRQDYPISFFGSHFIAIVKVAHLNKVDKNAHYYICGVPKMVMETEKKLLSKGVPLKNITIEGWEKFDKEVDLIHKFGRLNKLTNFFVNKFVSLFSLPNL